MVLDPPPAEQYRHIAPREIQKERKQESNLGCNSRSIEGLAKGNTEGNGGLWLELRIRSRSAEALNWLLSRLPSGSPFLGPSLLL